MERRHADPESPVQTHQEGERRNGASRTGDEHRDRNGTTSGEHVTEPTARGASGRASTQRVVGARDNTTACIGLLVAFLGAFSDSAVTVLVLGGLGALMGGVALLRALLGLEDDPRLALGCIGIGMLVAGWGLSLS